MQLTMKTRLFLLSCVALYFISTACGVDVNNSDGNVRNNNSIVEEPFSLAAKVEAHSIFRLEAINGTVTITGSSQVDSVIVSGFRRVGSESIADAEAHLPLLEVRLTNDGNQILIETIQPQQTRGRNYVVDYTILLPSHLQLDAGNINGNMSVADMKNGADVSNVNGNIALSGIVGDADVTLVNGNINGDVTIAEQGEINFTNVNGNLTLRVPQSTSAEFSASLTNGSISTSNLDMQVTSMSRTSLRGILGEGNGSISMRTVNGAIQLIGF